MLMPNAHRHKNDVVSQPPSSGAERGCAADRRAPDREGYPPFPAAELCVEERKRRGQHHRAADTLRDAAADELGPGLGERGEHAGRGKDDRAGDEQQPTPVTVGKPAPDEQQRGEDEGVCLLHPLRVA